MSGPNSIEKTLQEIIESQAFERLDAFEDSQVWSLLSDFQREKLALLFVIHGEQLLKKGEGKPSHLFDRACKIAPTSNELFYRLALAYFTKSPNLHYLILARQAAEKSLALNPQCLKTSTILCEVLMAIGLHAEDCESLFEAEKQFQEVGRLQKKQCVKEETFFYRWGLCWHFIAKRSGEASDYHQAIAKYRIAMAEGFQSVRFINDFGNALVDVGCLLCRESCFVEAIELYRRVVKESADFFDGWFNLACCYQRLYELTHNDQLFHHAYECFERSSLLNTKDPILWFKWAQLLVYTGKEKRRLDFVQASLDKFEKADLNHPNHPQIICDWAESLLLIGAEKDQLVLLKEAEKKIAMSVELKSDCASSWCVYGSCLNELGRYFADEDFYNRAIEKFQHGVSINRSDPHLWHGLALANFALGELYYDHVLVERAVRDFSRAVEFSGNRFLQFWNDWGVALMKLGEMIGDKHSIDAGVRKLEHAIKSHCQKHEPSTLNVQWLYNYGCALDFLGDFHLDEKYYEQAIQIFSQVLVADPEFMAARYSLGIAYSHLGEAASDEEMFQKAIEQFQMITLYDMEDDMTYNEWGLSLLHIAQLVHGEESFEVAEKYYKEAESKLLQASVLGNTQAYYNLSCLYSLMGNYTVSLHYMERAEAANILPSLDSILHDEWLSGLCSTDAFRDFLSHLSTKLEQKKSET